MSRKMLKNKVDTLFVAEKMFSKKLRPYQSQDKGTDHLKYDSNS